MLRLAMTKNLRFSPVASQHRPAANRVAKLCLVGLLLGKPQASSNTLLYFCLLNVPGCERKSPLIRLINKAPFPGNWILTLEGKIWCHICKPHPPPQPPLAGSVETKHGQATRPWTHKGWKPPFWTAAGFLLISWDYLTPLPISSVHKYFVALKSPPSPHTGAVHVVRSI